MRYLNYKTWVKSWKNFITVSEQIRKELKEDRSVLNLPKWTAFFFTKTVFYFFLTLFIAGLVFALVTLIVQLAQGNDSNVSPVDNEVAMKMWVSVPIILVAGLFGLGARFAFVEEWTKKSTNSEAAISSDVAFSFYGQVEADNNEAKNYLGLFSVEKAINLNMPLAQLDFSQKEAVETKGTSPAVRYHVYAKEPVTVNANLTPKEIFAINFKISCTELDQASNAN